ncbi:MAG: ankyrin repeat domain-containing protein [Limisphaerales bacterium]
MPLESGVAGEVEFAFGVVVDLHYAASPGRAGLLQELRERGVSVDATNDWGATVLLIAAGSGHTDFRKVSSPLLFRGWVRILYWGGVGLARIPVWIWWGRARCGYCQGGSIRCDRLAALFSWLGRAGGWGRGVPGRWYGR